MAGSLLTKARNYFAPRQFPGAGNVGGGSAWGGGGVVSFNPIIGSATLIEWNAARLLTGFSDGQAVATFTDQSGNGNSPTQATGSKQPLFKTGANGINGRAVLRYDGVDDAQAVTLAAS